MEKATWETIGDFKVSNIFLGKGQSCEVFYGVHVKTGEKVAAKKIDINQITQRLEKQLENEIKNMTNLTSPFIVRLLGYMRYQNKKQKENHLYLFLQYCDDIDLKKYLDNGKKKGTQGLCEAEAMLFMRHIIEGYRELYNNHIIHRDIKPANILLKQGVAKLSDFGFSRVVEDPETPDKFTLLGTPLYTAPEILKAGKFSSKCDVWSVGIMFYEMLYGKTPWMGKDLGDLRDNIHKRPLEFGQIKRKEELKDLIKRMLKIKDDQRISWPEVFNHPIFKQQLPKAKINNEAVSYDDYKQVFLEYLKNNIVKSYLRFNMSGVSFKQPQEPGNDDKKKIIESISKKLTHQRNVAFLYAYVLALYYNNSKIVPKTVNQGMEFEYALAKKAFNRIASIGATYINKEPSDYNKQTWKIFKESAEYDELAKILNIDYKVLHTLIQQISSEVQKCYKNGKIKPQYVEIIKNIDKQTTYEDMIRMNQKQLQKNSKTGVCALIAYYIDLCINPKQIEQNQKLEFGPFYELRERQYGLD